MEIRGVPTPPPLPELAFRPAGAWIPLLVGPRLQHGLSSLVIIQTYDASDDAGIGWVLGADKTYLDVPPRLRSTSAELVPTYEQKCWVSKVPVKRGDCVMFRRFLRTHGLMQADILTAEQREALPAGWETFFIHVWDLVGVLEGT